MIDHLHAITDQPKAISEVLRVLKGITARRLIDYLKERNHRVNYIHNNPLNAGMAERAIDYRWSSARIWQGCPLDDEPLSVDVDRIVWRRAKFGA